MLKILTSEQIKSVDGATIGNEPIASIDLMERACQAFVKWFVSKFHTGYKVGIVCGTGNNGGDGLAIARILKGWGYQVKVWIIRGGVKETSDFKINLDRLEHTSIIEIKDSVNQLGFDHTDVIIDAIFGSGLSRPVEGIYAEVIRVINETEAYIVAVDIPSGLRTNEPSSGAIVEADFTITFQLPKLAFFIPENYSFAGEWITIDIGLYKPAIEQAETDYSFLQKKDVKKLIKPRQRFDHKGTYGHALLIAGSYGKIGASILAGRAALRAGVGLLTVHTPKEGYFILQTALPEAMAQVDANPHYFTESKNISSFTSIGIGPGLGQDKETLKGLEQVLRNFTRPVVLDADAINLIAANSQLLHLIPQNSILTPHIKEFERLTGSCKNGFERLQKQRNFARQVKSYIILKGAFTSIATPDGKVFFNSTGNPGMATAGTGDVLTGILTSLLAQNYSPFECCLLGVYLHGLAGDLASIEKGMASLIASDVVENLPTAFKKLQRE